MDPFSLFFAVLVVLVGICAIGGWARRVLKMRFGRDFAIDAAGVCVLLFAGAAWGVAQQNLAQVRLGSVLMMLAIALAYLELGALLLGGERRTPWNWAGCVMAVAASLLLLGGVAFFNYMPAYWSIA